MSFGQLSPRRIEYRLLTGSFSEIVVFKLYLFKDVEWAVISCCRLFGAVASSESWPAQLVAGLRTSESRKLSLMIISF